MFLLQNKLKKPTQTCHSIQLTELADIALKDLCCKRWLFQGIFLGVVLRLVKRSLRKFGDLLKQADKYRISNIKIYYEKQSSHCKLRVLNKITYGVVR